MGVILDLIFDAVVAGFIHRPGGRRTDLDDFFGKGYSVVILFFAAITGFYACTAVMTVNSSAYWLPVVVAFVGTSFCGLMLARPLHVSLAGGLAACAGTCIGLAVGLFGLFLSLMTFK